MGDVRILTVCTANICRSPATAVLLERGLRSVAPHATVVSAGVAAVPGSDACDLTSALVGNGAAADDKTADRLAGHQSRRLTADEVAAADLILALDRGHRSAIAQLHPASRARTLTLRQAAAASQLMVGALQQGGLPEGAPPIPAEPRDRFAWWVGELDAHRGLITWSDSERAQPLAFDPQDVPDPHVVGYQYHPMAVELIADAVDNLLESLNIVMTLGAPDG